jgi:hypothetical protein
MKVEIMTEHEIAQFNQEKLFLKNQIDQEFTPSEKEAVLIQVIDAIDSNRLFEFYREPRNGRNILMARVYPKNMVKTNV